MNLEEMSTLIQVAAGRAKADLVIKNGSLVNVYTGELLDGYSVAIKGERIAYAGEDAGQVIGTTTKVIDAAGKIIVPGFIDSHTHLSFCTLDEFLRYAFRGGTTTIATEIIDVAFTLGFSGVRAFLESGKNQPIKIFGFAPSQVSLSPGSKIRAIDKEQTKELLGRADILGLGETYWLPVVEREPGFLELFVETLKVKKIVTGHSAGAKGKKLAAYAASGVCSCHEPISAEEVLERLRLGLYVPTREGKIRKDLAAIAKIKDLDLDLHQFILASDGISLKQVMEEGYMDVILKKAIALGFDPITAIQMVTINPARYLHLEDRLGGIAPGKYADIVILTDLRDINAEYVISNGRVIARNKVPLVQPRKYIYPEWTQQNMRIVPAFKPDDFIIHLPKAAGSSSARVRVIAQVEELVTQEIRLAVPVSGGTVTADPGQDLLKVVAVDFLSRQGTKFVGLVQGFNLKKGAVASSAAWDLANIVAVGASDIDLALAINRIVQMQGGAVVCADGQVLAEFSLPIGGCLSPAPIENLLQNIEDFQRAAVSLGAPFQDVHLTLITLTTPAIPFFRICEEGLVDIRTNKIYGLMVD